MFVDHIKIFAKAGDGGCGCVSFRREKFVPKGGPDGGDGGRGGDIILRVDANVDNLANFFYEPIIRAKNGENGLGKNMYGRAAHSKHVLVPAGTLVYRMPPDLAAPPQPDDWEEEPVKKPKQPISTEDLELVADLKQGGEEFLLCKGGGGGKGNVHF